MILLIDTRGFIRREQLPRRPPRIIRDQNNRTPAKTFRLEPILTRLGSPGRLDRPRRIRIRSRGHQGPTYLPSSLPHTFGRGPCIPGLLRIRFTGKGPVGPDLEGPIETVLILGDAGLFAVEGFGL